MRNISTTLKRKIDARIQAGDNALSASLWVGRPTTPLTENRFLEKQTVLSSSNITKTSIAVCHPRLIRGATEVYIGYLESGVIKIARAKYVEEMNRHQWNTDIGFSQEADSFCLCFDGTMPKAPNGYVELKTEQLPWVFWTLGGKLYAKRIDDTEPVVLAEVNCTAVTAIRAMQSEVGSFDFGLVLFFLLSGSLYYRQFINGEWTDAIPVSFGPDGAIWEDIVAFRTWDYRIGVQAKDTTGAIYELFTQFMGIGKQNVEHIELKHVQVSGSLTGVKYKDTANTEHIELAEISAGALYGGLYSTGLPSFITARNIPVDAESEAGEVYQNWGKVVLAELDVHLKPASVAANAAQFTMTDSKGQTFVAADAKLISANGLTLQLTFADFNAASGACTITYTPGTIATMYDLTAEAMSVVFVPENLMAPAAEAPKAVQAYTISKDGTQIVVEFSEAITSGLSADGWTVTIPEYDMVPGGTLSQAVRPVVSTRLRTYMADSVDLAGGTLTDTECSFDTLTLKGE